MRRLIIIGASGHGKVVADIAVLNGYRDIAFLDDDESVKQCGQYKVIGKSTDAERLNDIQNSDFFVAIGNCKTREKIMSRLQEASLDVVRLIHPNAVIAKNTIIGAGTVIMAGVVINPDVEIGQGCIVNTGATIDHDNKISEFVHVSVGSHLAGTVEVGRYTWIGIGACVSNNVNVGEDCMIGAGAVVLKDLPNRITAVGVPATVIK